ncbi:MAG: histidine phosphatase family protein [Patescibacteria group bacterium]
MKKIYFIRHGESEDNEKAVLQGHDSSLTDNGRKQSLFVAEKLAKSLIDVVISSPIKRAKETADIIVKKINRPLETSDLLMERRRPKEQIGKSLNDPEILRIEGIIKNNFHIENFRFSDEENFEDLKNRAARALVFLQARPEQNILAVTHGFFMAVIMAYLIFGDKLTGHECRQFTQKFHMENTGITVLNLERKESGLSWKLSVWNDQAHLS